jgi:hypothetical protein
LYIRQVSVNKKFIQVPFNTLPLNLIFSVDKELNGKIHNIRGYEDPEG